MLNIRLSAAEAQLSCFTRLAESAELDPDDQVLASALLGASLQLKETDRDAVVRALNKQREVLKALPESDIPLERRCINNTLQALARLIGKVVQAPKPRMTAISETAVRLTDAQASALECAGLDLSADDLEPEERLLAAVWQGNKLRFQESERDTVHRALINLSNAEDAMANDDNRDTLSRRHARGAAQALSNLATLVSQAPVTQEAVAPGSRSKSSLGMR